MGLTAVITGAGKLKYSVLLLPDAVLRYKGTLVPVPAATGHVTDVADHAEHEEDEVATELKYSVPLVSMLVPVTAR